MLRVFASTCLGVAALISAASGATAATVTYDFNSGIGTDFEIVNSQNKFTIGTTGTIHISKGADSPPVANEFIGGGIRANFALGGDFTATVDVLLTNLPSAGGANMLNEAVLSAGSTSNPNNGVSVLRFTAGATNFVELFASPPGLPIGLTPNSATSGRFRLTRTGATVSGFFDPESDGSFNFIGSAANVSDNYELALLAVQGANLGTRSSTPIDLSFDNLVITADFLVPGDVPVPEPMALGMLGLWLAGLGYARLLGGQLQSARHHHP